MPADTDALLTIQDLVRWGACRFADARLYFGHGTDNAFDEAVWLVASALNMPIARIDAYRDCRVTADERTAVLALLDRRISERRPAAYLTGQAWFAGMEFIVDDAVLIPRSPLAELICDGFAPWIDPDRIGRALDLCTGSGCLGIALACASAGRGRGPCGYLASGPAHRRAQSLPARTRRPCAHYRV